MARQNFADHALKNSKTLSPVETPQAGFVDRAEDLGIDFLKGAIELPQSLVGLLDIPTGGHIGKFLEDSIGYKPDEALSTLSSLYSPERKQEQRDVSKSFDESFFGGLGSAVTNPAVAIGSIAESLPMMLGGRAIAGGVVKAAELSPFFASGASEVAAGTGAKYATHIAAGAGEGLLSAGSTEEQIRADSDNGLTTASQGAIAAGSGLLTGVLGAVSNKITKAMGFTDLDIAEGAADKALNLARKSYLKQVSGGILTEGIIEELPQSAQEQIAANVATGKKWNEGVKEAAGMGAIAGAATGGAMNLHETFNNNLDVAKIKMLKEGLDDIDKTLSGEQIDPNTPSTLESGSNPTVEEEASINQSKETLDQNVSAIDEEILSQDRKQAAEATIPDRVKKSADALGVEDYGMFMSAVHGIYSGVKTSAQFTAELVKQFGAKAKQHALQLWTQMKKIIGNQNGYWIVSDKSSTGRVIRGEEKSALAKEYASDIPERTFAPGVNRPEQADLKDSPAGEALVNNNKAVKHEGVYYVRSTDDTPNIAGSQNSGSVYVNLEKSRQLMAGDLSVLSDSKFAMFNEMGITPQQFVSIFQPDIKPKDSEQTKANKKKKAQQELNRFLTDHEKIHIANEDIESYPKDENGKFDVNHPDAIAIEVRATEEALNPYQKRRFDQLFNQNVGNQADALSPKDQTVEDQLRRNEDLFVGGENQRLGRNAQLPNGTSIDDVTGRTVTPNKPFNIDEDTPRSLRHKDRVNVLNDREAKLEARQINNDLLRIRTLNDSILDKGDNLKRNLTDKEANAERQKFSTNNVKVLANTLEELKQTPLGKDLSNKSKVKNTKVVAKNEKMFYTMPSSENIYGIDTTTLELSKNGKRTATTRSFKLGNGIGSLITFEGDPQLYEITGYEQLTDEKSKDKKWVTTWSKKEGWTEDHFNKSYNKKNTVKKGSWQTTFKKVKGYNEDTQTPKLVIDKRSIKQHLTDIFNNKQIVSEAEAIVSDLIQMTGRYNLNDVVNYIKRQEHVDSLSQLTSYPVSLTKLNDELSLARSAGEEEYKRNKGSQAEIDSSINVKLLERIKGEFPSQLRRSSKFLKKLVSSPDSINSIIKKHLATDKDGNYLPIKEQTNSVMFKIRNDLIKKYGSEDGGYLSEEKIKNIQNGETTKGKFFVSNDILRATADSVITGELNEATPDIATDLHPEGSGLVLPKKPKTSSPGRVQVKTKNNKNENTEDKITISKTGNTVSAIKGVDQESANKRKKEAERRRIDKQYKQHQAVHNLNQIARDNIPAVFKVIELLVNEGGTHKKKRFSIDQLVRRITVRKVTGITEDLYNMIVDGNKEQRESGNSKKIEQANKIVADILSATFNLSNHWIRETENMIDLDNLLDPNREDVPAIFENDISVPLSVANIKFQDMYRVTINHDSEYLNTGDTKEVFETSGSELKGSIDTLKEKHGENITIIPIGKQEFFEKIPQANDTAKVLSAAKQRNVYTQQQIDDGLPEKLDNIFEDAYGKEGEKRTTSDEVAGNAKLALKNEIRKVQIQLTKQAFNASHLSQKDAFERIAKKHEDLGWTAADILDQFIKAGQNPARMKTLIEQRRESQLDKKIADHYAKLKRTGGVDKKTARQVVTEGFSEESKTKYEQYMKPSDTETKQKIIGELSNRERVEFAAMKNFEEKLKALGHGYLEDADYSAASESADRGMAPRVSDMFESNEKPTGFEAEIAEKVEMVGKLRHKISRLFYEKVAKAFGSDLVVVNDPEYRTRYIPKASDGRPKIVININRRASFHKVFAHELHHHISNKVSPAEYRAFTDGVKGLLLDDPNLGTTSTTRQDVLTGQITKTDIAKTGLSRWNQMVDAISEKEGVSREVAEQEALSELFSSVMSQSSFYFTLASSTSGSKVAGKLVTRLLSHINKIDANIGKAEPFTYEGEVLLQSSEMGKIYDLVVDLIGATENSTSLQHGEIRYHTKLGARTYAEVKGWLDNPKKWLQGSWKKVFKPGTKSYKDVMTNIEKIVTKALKWLSNAKPDGVFADVGVSSAEQALAGMLVHHPVRIQTELYHSKIKKHLETFKGIGRSDLEDMHDFFVRGLVRKEDSKKRVVVDKLDADLKSGKITSKVHAELTNRVNIGLTTTEDVGAPDLSTTEGIDKAKEHGYSDEVIAAYKDYKQISDDIYTELVKIYPDLKRVDTHYGQSLKWRTKGAGSQFLTNDFSSAIQREDSSLANSKHYTKDKNLYQRTEEIADEHDLDYKTIDPNRMITEYIQDAYKLIYTKKMINLAIKQGHGKIFTDAATAKKEGWHDIDDPAFDILSKVDEDNPVNVDTGFTVKSRKDGSRVEAKTFENEEAAKEYARETQKANPEEKIVLVLEKVQDSEKPIARVYFKPGLARMLRVAVAKDNFRNGKLLGVSGHTALNVKNQMTAIEFAMSPFHAFTIGNEALASTLSWTMRTNKGIKKLSGLNLRKTMRESAELSALYTKVLESPDMAKDPAIIKKFGELLNVTNPDVLGMISQYHNQGGFLHQDVTLRGDTHSMGKVSYRAGEITADVKNDKAVIDIPKRSLKAVMGSIKDVYNKQVADYPDKNVKALFNTMRFSIMEGSTQWLMEDTIPKVKLALFLREYSLKLEQQKFLLESEQTSKEAIAHDTMKFIEDRMGEVNWANQWINPSIKSGLQFLFRSFSWFTGSWKALSKAGIDIGKLGWFTVKGEKHQLTEKGMWGMNAVLVHMLTAGLITAAYSIGAGIDGDEVEDPETSYLVRALFPRVDPHDPTARITVPSYVSELYKILVHIGAIGSHAEFSKLFSGRVNSFIGNSIEAYNGENFRGVTIRDSHDSVAKQAFDSILHIFSVAPISLSSAYGSWQQKGWNAAPIALSLLGMPPAPAVAKRSAATNLAFQIRREEYKGRAISEDEMSVKDKTKRAAYAYSQGDRKDLNKMLQTGEISLRKFKNALSRFQNIDGKKNNRYVSPIISATKGLTIEGALKVYDKASDAEKKKLEFVVRKKYINVKGRNDRSPQVKEEIRLNMKELGLL